MGSLSCIFSSNLSSQWLQIFSSLKAVSEVYWDKNKSICSSSSSQLSGQICQIPFVMLAALAVCICHRAEVWFLTDLMQPNAIMLVCCTGYAPALQLSSAKPFSSTYHQESEVSAKTLLRGSLCSRQMTDFVFSGIHYENIGHTITSLCVCN